MNEKITIKYQTTKEYCSCCSSEFEIPELGEVREFDITLNDFFAWTDWKEDYEIDEEDVTYAVNEYLFDTISFYALNSNENLKICSGEAKKVIEMLLGIKGIKHE